MLLLWPELELTVYRVQLVRYHLLLALSWAASHHFKDLAPYPCTMVIGQILFRLILKYVIIILNITILDRSHVTTLIVSVKL